MTMHSEHITDEMIEAAYEKQDMFGRIDSSVIPEPTWSYEVGDPVQVGNLRDCEVAEVLEGGKVYRIEYISRDNNYGRGPIDTVMTNCWWWFDVEPREFADGLADDLFKPHLPGQPQQSSIDSLTHMMSSGGLVCDPRYQRGYVWSLEDQEALIDSVFNRMSIGSLIFSRHSGYLHEGKGEKVTYINLGGEEVTIDREDDNTVAVIDGQQRATTLWRFITNQFTYKGRLYKELSPRDQGDFNSSLIS